MTPLQTHLFAILSPILASISQVIIKWQTNQVGQLPDGLGDKTWFLLEFLLRPWVAFAIFATFISGISWIVALTKLDLSYAYPYAASTFILVPMSAVLILGESFSLSKMFGGVLILIGIAIVMTRG